MKFSPLILFLLIISVLLISLLFSRYLPLEGFIDFNYSDANKNVIGLPNNSIIPIYSPTNTLIRLYDNLYFDCQNGNIIEVDGPLVSGNATVGNTTVSGTTITGTWVTQRNGTTNSSVYTTETDSNNKIKQKAIDAAGISTVSDSKYQFIYSTKATTANASKYQILYIANGTDTYIHIIDVTTSASGRQALKHLATYISNGCGIDKNNTFMTQQTLGKVISNTANSALNTDTSNNIIVKDTIYDETHNVYQLSPNVKYDVKNGYLIIKKNGKNSTSADMEIYNRSFTKLDNATYTTTNGYNGPIANVEFNSFLVEDATANPNTVLYIVSAKKTIIAILQKTATGYAIGSVKRFNETGLDETVVTTPGGQPSTPPTTNASGAIPPDASGNVYSEYYKWLAFWNATAQGNAAYSDDYMLKTSVVPPVCPSCPSCNSCASGGVCANCGGKGGSGTLSGNGASIAGGSISGSATPGSITGSGSMLTGSGTGQMTTQGRGTYATTSDTNTLGGATTVQTLGVVSGVENVAQTGADVISGTVGTVGNLAGQALSTTGGLLYAGGSGAVNLAKSAGSGTVDLVKSAGSGTANLLTNGRQGYDNQPAANQRTSIPTGAPSTGYSPNYNDNYSRYGALQGRGSSNFIPVTADFSKFGR